MIRTFIKWVMGQWYAHNRHIDLAILWPCCKSAAPNLDNARAAFAVHVFNDPSWLVLGQDEIKRRINEIS
jgi:hypothetical protein